MIQIPEGEEKTWQKSYLKKKKEKEKLFEDTVAVSFPYLGKETDQIQVATESPSKTNSRRWTARHIVIKMSKWG